MSKIELIMGIAQIFSQLFIGLAVIYSAHRVACAQYSKSIQDAWQDYNKLVL